MISSKTPGRSAMPRAPVAAALGARLAAATVIAIRAAM